MSRKYFEEEIRYLQEAGKAFAKAYPDRARYLNIDSITDRDPYVERLFEGFAFIAGKVHERLDDDLPEYTEGLFNLIWPHYLKSFPSMAILEFQPRVGMLQESTVLPKGTEVRSGAVGKNLIECKFLSTQDVHAHPMRLDDVKLSWRGQKTTLAFDFSLDKGITFENLTFEKDGVPLFLLADLSLASTLHLYLTRHVGQIFFEIEADNGYKVIARGDQEWVQPGGLEEDEGLIPYSRFSFLGFRLLQEYFNFRQKYNFVRLGGFSQLQLPEGVEKFRVRIELDRIYPEELRFTAENIRLYCTPICNLFEKDAVPVRIDHLSSEYRLKADIAAPEDYEIWDINQVIGIEEKGAKRHVYRPYFSFERANHRRFYYDKTRLEPSGQHATYLTILGSDLDEDLETETLSITARCNNRSLPRERVKIGEISQAPPGMPDLVRFKNLTQPTLNLQPPEPQNYFWKLLSHMSTSHMSIATPEAMKNLLKLYDWADQEGNRQRINGIRDVSWKPRERVYKGAVIRGSEVILEIQDGSFSDEGDVCLFGLVMSRFLSMYATINSFVYLTIKTMPSEKIFEWTPQVGVKSPI